MSPGDRVRLASCRDDKRIAVDTKPDDGAVGRQHVDRRPSVRQIRLREPHFVVNETREKPVRHGNEALQTLRRLSEVEAVKLLAKRRHGRLVSVYAACPAHRIERDASLRELVILQRKLVHELVHDA